MGAMEVMTSHPKKVLLGGVAVLAVLTIMDGFYIVQPTEMGGVRCWGTVMTPEKEPVLPGVHLKIPFICHADTIQISLDKIDLDTIEVHTFDNQKIKVGISMTYRIPSEWVIKLLYRVGRTGSVDIKSNILPIVRDRTAKVFARYNTQDISSKREKIGVEITSEVDAAIEKFFGVQIVDMQIKDLEYSKAFEDSNNLAVLKKNDVIAERYKVEIEQQQAAQKVAREKGDGDAKEARARGDAAAKLAIAEADAKAIELVAIAQAKRLSLAGKAYADYPQLAWVEVAKEAASKWNGGWPQNFIMGSGASSVLPFMNLTPSVPTANPTK